MLSGVRVEAMEQDTVARIRQTGAAFRLIRDGRAACRARRTVSGKQAVVVETAFEQLNRYLRGGFEAGLPVAKGAPEAADGDCLLAVAGRIPSFLKGRFDPPRVGEQGFCIRQVPNGEGRWLVVWGETPLGCRYGLMEVLRSLRTQGRDCFTDLEYVVDAPRFPVRIYYLNAAEHLQNAFNINTAYNVPFARWSREDWERLLELMSAMRYTTFEFWLYPTLFSPDALKEEKGSLWERFAADMRWIIDRAHRLGIQVELLQAVNTIGPEWHYHCPNLPEERKVILALWEHWAKKLPDADMFGLFPGDPGGCNRNGCTHETYISLCLDIIRVQRRHGRFRYHVGTWGTPFWGWGEALRTPEGWQGEHDRILSGWEGGPERAQRAFAYLMMKLPEFPPDTLFSVCMGLNPESDGDSHGGSSKPYVEELRRTHPVITWDYAASEGEGAVIPHFRVAKILSRRQKEAAWGYSGGINYTMTPRLNVLQAFAAGEAYWNPDQTSDAILSRFSEFVFGKPDVAAQVFPYTEVVADWGGGGLSGTMPELLAHLRQARAALNACIPPKTPKLPVLPDGETYRQNLLWYLSLFERLAETAVRIEKVRALTGRNRLNEVRDWLQAAPGGAQKERVQEILAQLERRETQEPPEEFFRRVYGLYDLVQSLPDTPVHRGGKRWLGFARSVAAMLSGPFHRDFFAGGE
jgi:hypothetical protein